MKKNLVKRVLIIIIVMTITTTISVGAATLINSKNIFYTSEKTEADNVSDALDELYENQKTFIEENTKELKTTTGSFGGSYTASKDGVFILSGSVFYNWGNSNSLSGYCKIYMKKNGTIIGSWASESATSFLNWHKKIDVKKGDKITMNWDYGFYQSNYSASLGNPSGIVMGGGSSWGTNIYTYSYFN